MLNLYVYAKSEASILERYLSSTRMDPSMQEGEAKKHSEFDGSLSGISSRLARGV